MESVANTQQMDLSLTHGRDLSIASSFIGVRHRVQRKFVDQSITSLPKNQLKSFIYLVDQGINEISNNPDFQACTDAQLAELESSDSIKVKAKWDDFLAFMGGSQKDYTYLFSQALYPLLSRICIGKMELFSDSIEAKAFQMIYGLDVSTKNNSIEYGLPGPLVAAFLRSPEKLVVFKARLLDVLGQYGTPTYLIALDTLEDHEQGMTDFLDIVEWRALFGLTEDKYKEFKDFNRYVFKQAANTINKSEESILDVDWVKKPGTKRSEHIYALKIMRKAPATLPVVESEAKTVFNILTDKDKGIYTVRQATTKEGELIQQLGTENALKFAELGCRLAILKTEMAAKKGSEIKNTKAYQKKIFQTEFEIVSQLGNQGAFNQHVFEIEAEIQEIERALGYHLAKMKKGVVKQLNESVNKPFDDGKYQQFVEVIKKDPEALGKNYIKQTNIVLDLIAHGASVHDNITIKKAFEFYLKHVSKQ